MNKSKPNYRHREKKRGLLKKNKRDKSAKREKLRKQLRRRKLPLQLLKSLNNPKNLSS